MSESPVNVRYMVDDPVKSADWYVENFGFSRTPAVSPAFAAVERGPLRLLLSGKMSSAGRPMPADSSGVYYLHWDDRKLGNISGLQGDGRVDLI